MWISWSRPLQQFLADSAGCGVSSWWRNESRDCTRWRCRRASHTKLRPVWTSASATATPAVDQSPRQHSPEALVYQTECSSPASGQSPSRTSWRREGCLASPCSWSTCSPDLVDQSLGANDAHCCANKNKHPMGCEAQLASKCLFTTTFWRAILARKVR